MACGTLQGFDTTQGKQTDDDAANLGAVKVQSKRAARQYMNRKVRPSLRTLPLLPLVPTTTVQAASQS